MNSLVYLFYPKICFCLVKNCSLVIVKKKIIRRVVKNGLLFCFAAIIIYKNVTHDRKKPCFYVSADIIFFLVCQRFIQSFLEQILSRLRILGEIICERL